MRVDANNARFWVEEAGSRLAVLVDDALPLGHIAASVSGTPWGDELEAAYADADKRAPMRARLSRAPAQRA